MLFFGISPKPSSCTFVSTCICSHSGVGAFLRDFTKAFVLYTRSCFLASAYREYADGFFGLVACFWHCLDDVWHHFVLLAIACITPLFSSLKGDPPGTYPSSCQQKNNNCTISLQQIVFLKHPEFLQIFYFFCWQLLGYVRADRSSVSSTKVIRDAMAIITSWCTTWSKKQQKHTIQAKKPSTKRSKTVNKKGWRVPVKTRG